MALDPALNPFLARLQAMYGSIDPNRIQTRRRSYYSFTAYPTAGQTVFNFFSQTVGNSNRQLTNLQRSGQLDNPLIVKSIKCRYFITAQDHSDWTGADNSTLYSELVNGLFTSGVLRVIIGSKEWMVIPTPFFYAPPGVGMPEVYAAGDANTNVSRGPFAYLPNTRKAAYLVDPSFLIGSDQNFQITIEYPTGAIAATASVIIPNGTTLYIGVDLDGIEIRPVQ